jgi:transcriptional regulator with XRE-family HTH domain
MNQDEQAPLNQGEQAPYKSLGDFLVNRRRSLLPDQVGLLFTKCKRRKVGLRREEVATLIGCSIDWYTQVEQGRSKASLQLLERIAHVLHFTEAERAHLFDLADVLPSPKILLDNERITPALQRFLDSLNPNPAYVIGKRWDLVGWNKASCKVFANLEEIGIQERNILRLMFTSSVMRCMVVDWETHAKRVIREFRSDYGKYRNTSSFISLVNYLKVVSTQFGEWWESEGVDRKAEIKKEINHHQAGLLTLEQTRYIVSDASGLTVVVYIPLDDQTKQKIDRLWDDKA